MSGRILYISDMDGTLLGPDATLSDYASETLNRLTDGGLSFTVATARTAASTLKILAPLRSSVPIILMNGVLIYDRLNETYLRTCYLEPATAEESVTLVLDAGLEMFLYEMRDNQFTVWHEPLQSRYSRSFKAERVQKYYKAFTQTESLSALPKTHVIYLTILDTRERVQAMIPMLSSIRGITYTIYPDVYSGHWFLEIYSCDASKKNAALFLKEQYHFDRLVGFGDNLNDLPLFEACDYKLAVENAHPEVKASADEITDSNRNDGVAKWLAQHERGF